MKIVFGTRGFSVEGGISFKVVPVGTVPISDIALEGIMKYIADAYERDFDWQTAARIAAESQKVKDNMPRYPRMDADGIAKVAEVLDDIDSKLEFARTILAAVCQSA